MKLLNWISKREAAEAEEVALEEAEGVDQQVVPQVDLKAEVQVFTKEEMTLEDPEEEVSGKKGDSPIASRQFSFLIVTVQVIIVFHSL